MGMLWPTLEFILGVAMIITLLAGGHLVIAHRISVGQFVAFNTYMVLLTWPIIAVGWVVNIFQRGTASVKRIDELLRAEPVIDDSNADPAIQAGTVLQGEIEFCNLNFSYGETLSDSGVLRDISLKIPAGSSLAIVGPTGSGKSTLVNLITRLYEAPEGSLLIDGRGVRDYPLAVLRRNIGMVPRRYGKTLLLARPMPARKSCSRRPRRRTFVRSSKSFRRDLKPWWASAASRSPAGRNNARPLPEHYCAGRQSLFLTTRYRAWTPSQRNVF